MTLTLSRGSRSAAPLLLLALAAGALAWLPLEWAAAGLAGAAGSVVLLRRPWLVWVVVGAALPFAAAVRVGPATGVEILLVGALGLWFADGVRRGSLRLKGSAPLAAALVYLALLLSTSLRARDLSQALIEVIKWGEFALLLAVLPVMLRAPAVGAEELELPFVRRRVIWLALAIAAGAAAQALLGLYQFFFRVGPEWFTLPGGFMRAAGTYGQPNPFAGSLGLVLPVAVSLGLYGWGKLRRSGEGWGWAIVWSGLSLLLLAGLLASWSRGGWFGAAAALVAVVVLRSRRAALVAGVALLILLFAMLLGSVSPAALEALLPDAVTARLAEIPAFFGYGDPLQQEVTDENFAVIERVAHWVAALRMFAAEPWLGVGAGSYAAAYADFAVPRWDEALGHAHNAWLNTLAELGLAGLAAVTLLWGTVAFWLARDLRRSTRALASTGAEPFAADRALIVGLLGVLVHLAVHSLVDLLFVQGMVATLGMWTACRASGASSVECRVSSERQPSRP